MAKIENPAVTIPKKKLNLWMMVSFGLLIILVAVIVFKPNISGKAVANADNIGPKTVDFINNYLISNGTANLSSVNDLGNVYEINVTYNGKIIPTYATKDGKYFMQGLLSMDNPPKKSTAASSAAANTPQNVTKSDKPVAEAYVFAYCPYGLQFEKALLPVYSLLKDKADINIVFIGAMHGEYEHVESLRQLCILKEYGKDKLFEYLDKFNADTKIGACSKDTTCSLPLVEELMSSISIDKAKIDSCMSADAEALYKADNAKASSLGITGSPTFVINGAKVQPSSRSPEAVKSAICSAFTTSPSECSQNLSSTAASAGFGASTAAASSGGGCGA